MRACAMRARGRQGSRAAAGPPAARGRRWMPVAWSATRGGPRFCAAPRRPVRPCAPLRARAVPSLRPCACCMRPAIPASRRPPCAARLASGHAGTARRPSRSTRNLLPVSDPRYLMQRRRGGRPDPPPGEPATFLPLSRPSAARPRAGAGGLGRRGAAGEPRACHGWDRASCRGAPASGCGAARGQRRWPPIPGIPPQSPTASVVDPAGQIRIPRRHSGRPRHRPASRGEPSPAIPRRRRLAPCGPHPRPPDPRGSSCRRPRRPSPWPEGGGA